MALDLKSQPDRDALYKLVRNADVFLHNFRVGTVERLGVSYDDLRPLNPQLIYCSISGYGETGP